MPPFFQYVISMGVSNRSLQTKLMPVLVVTVTSIPGLMSEPRSTVNCSLPFRPRESAFWPSLKHMGTMPMPQRLERWMRSKLSAITALTPCRYGPLAAQSRDDPLPYSLPARMIRECPSALYFSAASNTDMVSPDGMCTVTGPVCPVPASLLEMRVLAKVPRAMIRSLPRRAPYELNSDWGTSRDTSHLAAGDVLAMLPAGEMWSVVMESPKFSRQ
mmetsp:Transcript_14449/g.26144  ORF Transcript_14449/g.26144 Transcript_14449/m.26144 type:complete len:216 (-) Transcript_14449:2029-2676(-)